MKNSKVWAIADCANKAYTAETMLTDTMKAALLEELRFAKGQQWTITAAIVALIAGAYRHNNSNL